MKKKYSFLSLIKNAFTNNENWEKMWESREPKKGYDVIIVGGGGHGLGTAYYLAKEHGIKNIAVIEKGWLAGETQEEILQSLGLTIFGMKVLTYMIIQ